MPASWRICAAEPRAPESAIMKIELKDFWVTSSPAALVTCSVPRLSIMTRASRSLVCDQISTTLL